jgi:hypothetical protein
VVHIRETSKPTGVTPGYLRCKHDVPIEVTSTDTGYYARCLRCHEVGPGRPTSRAARQALLEQSLMSDEQRRRGQP